MELASTTIRVQEGAILEKILQILKRMTGDWDTGFTGDIGLDTYLVADLNCESLDIVQFVVAIEEYFRRRDLPMEKLLMVDGRYVDDLRVKDVVSFLYNNLNS